MPTTTYTPLATYTGTTSLLTFSSINQSYRDLICLCNIKMTSGTSQLMIQINGLTTNYQVVSAEGNGTTTSSSGATSTDGFYDAYVTASLNSTNYSPVRIEIFDYSTTDRKKVALIRSGESTTGISMTASSNATTSAITSFVVKPVGGTLTGTFTLYGIAA